MSKKQRLNNLLSKNEGFFYFYVLIPHSNYFIGVTLRCAYLFRHYFVNEKEAYLNITNHRLIDYSAGVILL